MSSKFVAAITSGLLLALPFLFPILFPLAWIFLISLFWLLQRERAWRQAFFFGWLTGGIANVLGFYWLDYTIRVFGGFPYGVSELIFLVFAAYGALPLALVALLVRLCGFGPLYLYPALFWVAIEFWFPLLFPWHLANSQSQFLALIQTADMVGPYGTSLLLVWLSTMLYAAISPRDRETKNYLRGAVVLSALLIGALWYGHWRLGGMEAAVTAARPLKVAAVQGNIDIRRKWGVVYLESNLKSYQELTKKVDEADLVIWPETAVEVWLPENIGRLPSEILPSLPLKTAFIFGARSFRGNPAMTHVQAFNSAFLADARGLVSGFYHKQILLAFGEYLPFAAVLSKLPGMPPLGDGFASGDGPRTLDLPNGVRAAPLVCYEDLMPALARRFVAEKGANLLVNLTNDAWFGNTAAPWQHLRLAQWRAIETRRYLVRVTNTGLTSVINAKGEIVETLPLFSPGVLTAKVALLEGETPYVRFGDWFAWAATLLALAAFAFRLVQLFKPSRSGDLDKIGDRPKGDAR
ncbi:MAG: apolipoprotein N-acyltransferase [Deltaproteobacteria bacterium]|nr:apolipoprotein N-acyltransferase [Deltaproteobacteria bacterium]